MDAIIADVETILDATSRSVVMAGNELGAFVDRLVRAEGGMTRVQYEVLGALTAAGRPVEPHEIARRLELGSGHLTAVLDGLERGGLVTRRRHDVDGRRRLVEPTDDGRRRLDWLRTVIGAAERRVLDTALGPDEQARLVDLLARLRTAIAGDTPPPMRPGP